MDLYRLLRPLVFALPPERAHAVVLGVLGVIPVSWVSALYPRVAFPVSYAGLHFPNPIGLAAGFDKDGRWIQALEALGFGCIEIGTVTVRPQAGNPKPRMFRLPAAEAFINRMGFNNAGLAAAQAVLARRRSHGAVLGANIGKQKETPLAEAPAEYVALFEGLAPYVDYITINISSPNTPGLRGLQAPEALEALLVPVKAAQQRQQDRCKKPLPLFVKIAPDLSREEIIALVEVTRAYGVEGIIATNTTCDRPTVQGLPDATESGGLSGRPLGLQALSVLQTVRTAADPTQIVIGVGGIHDPETILARQAAGAQLFQIYTGLIYAGPALIARLARALRAAA